MGETLARLVHGGVAGALGGFEAGVEVAALLGKALFVCDDALEFAEEDFFFFNFFGGAREEGFGKLFSGGFLARVELCHFFVEVEFDGGHVGDWVVEGHDIGCYFVVSGF